MRNEVAIELAWLGSTRCEQACMPDIVKHQSCLTKRLDYVNPDPYGTG
jgi:hypothetical protein